MVDVEADLITISLANLDAISQIIELSSSFHLSTILAEDKKAGFLDCPLFTTNELKQIINKNGLAIASYNDQIIGYYLIDNWSKNSITNDNRKVVDHLIDTGILLAHKRIAPRVQIVVNRAYQNKGLPRKLLNFIKPFLINEFDILFSIGMSSNPKKYAHIRSGWKLIYEDNKHFYVIYDLNA